MLEGDSCFSNTSVRINKSTTRRWVRVALRRGFPGGSAVKNLPAVQETQVQALSQEDSLEEGMATLSSILALENSIDRGLRQATVHGVAKSDMTERLSMHARVHTHIPHTHTHTHTH